MKAAKESYLCASFKKI